MEGDLIIWLNSHRKQNPASHLNLFNSRVKELWKWLINFSLFHLCFDTENLNQNVSDYKLYSLQLTSKITPLKIVLDPFPMMFSMSLINFSNFSGVICKKAKLIFIKIFCLKCHTLLRIPRTLLNTTSLWICSLSWGSASRLTEEGIHLC